MAIMANRYRVILLLFLAAAICYAAGFMGGFWLLIAIGGAFELAFWFELFSGRQRGRSSDR